MTFNDVIWHQWWHSRSIDIMKFDAQVKKRNKFFFKFFKRWNSSKKVKKRHKTSITNISVKLYQAWRVRKFDVKKTLLTSVKSIFKHQFSSFWRQLTLTLTILYTVDARATFLTPTNREYISMVRRQITSKPHIVGIEPGITRTEVRFLTTELRRLL